LNVGVLERRQETFPVSVAVSEPIELVGHSVNYSLTGVLVHAQCKLPVLLGIKGKQYRGLLVRASSVDRETTAYAIELTEALETSGR
jgi:hypothetical protein